MESNKYLFFHLSFDPFIYLAIYQYAYMYGSIYLFAYICVCVYIYIYIYSEREINKNDIFLRFDILSFTKTFYIYI